MGSRIARNPLLDRLPVVGGLLLSGHWSSDGGDGDVAFRRRDESHLLLDRGPVLPNAKRPIARCCGPASLCREFYRSSDLSGRW